MVQTPGDRKCRAVMGNVPRPTQPRMLLAAGEPVVEAPQDLPVAAHGHPWPHGLPAQIANSSDAATPLQEAFLVGDPLKVIFERLDANGPRVVPQVQLHQAPRQVSHIIVADGCPRLGVDKVVDNVHQIPVLAVGLVRLIHGVPNPIQLDRVNVVSRP
eukprot:2817918-Pyramimonas_sp.AAC.1